MAQKTIIKDFVQDNVFRVQVNTTAPTDWTGAVLDLTLKAAEDDATPALAVSHTVGDDPDDNAGIGLAYITVTGADTSAVAPGAYFAQLDLTIDGNTTTLLRSGVANAKKVVCTKTLKEHIV